MKMKKINFLLCLVLLIGFSTANAQSIDKSNYIVIRNDVVKPSMTVQYEGSLTDLSDFMTVNKVKDVNYLTQLEDNYHYSHVSFIDDLNDIEGGLRAYINGKKNSAEFDLIWSYLNETIESYSYYVVKYEPGLSYVADENLWLEEAPYRRWNYYYFTPGTEAQAEQIIAAWKSLYEKKGVKSGFRIFKGLIGLDGPVYVFTTWGASPLDYQKNIEENLKLLGEDGANLWMAMLAIVRGVETVEGWYLPQYSYQPE
jgi:hypothetical protein